MCRQVIKGILFIGFSIQIGLGLAWMCCNMMSAQDFAGVSAGIYALVMGLPKGFRPAIYGLQLLAAGLCGRRLVQRLCGGGRLFALWGSLALMALPMAMQCHLALLPYSFVCSAGLLQLSFCCDMLQDAPPVRHVAFWQYTERPGASCFRPFAGIVLCFFAQTLLLPEYLFLGAVPPLLAFCLRWRAMRRERTALRAFLLFAVAAAVGTGFCALGQPGIRAEGGNDVSGLDWALVKRACWPTLWVDYDAMPEKLREAVDGVLIESTYYPGNMESLFRPAVEEAMDLGEAKPLFREMAAHAWEVHSPMIIRQIGWDALGYCITPIILQLQLAGDAYESYSGRNYEIMRNESPILTKHYVNYGSWWFAAAIVLTAVLTIARLAAGEKPWRRREWLLAVIVFFGAGLSVLWYVLQGAGVMDYKYTVLINQMWFIWSLTMIRERRRDEEEVRRM